jgi:transcriptional regulator with XRE-family HTH domain
MQYIGCVTSPACGLAESLLLEAQRRSKLTSSAWASKAGVSRALLHNYLRGRHQPSLPQLDRLLRAAGQELHVSLRPVPTWSDPGAAHDHRPSRAEQARALLDVLSVADAIPVRRETELSYPLLRDLSTA